MNSTKLAKGYDSPPGSVNSRIPKIAVFMWLGGWFAWFLARRVRLTPTIMLLRGFLVPFPQWWSGSVPTCARRTNTYSNAPSELAPFRLPHRFSSFTFSGDVDLGAQPPAAWSLHRSEVRSPLGWLTTGPCLQSFVVIPLSPNRSITI